jgi:hypothetical protein
MSERRMPVWVLASAVRLTRGVQSGIMAPSLVCGNFPAGDSRDPTEGTPTPRCFAKECGSY